ncbi:serine hydrolase domain-containing protein [Frondihabitans cladoniiphilus]|uniref:Serine hydrolase domain-containing protein n=1 Tax=Frondihabitans cladoniiphilus TaxID=715785 RepID=A0ABP8W1K9_9MICO
MSAGSNGAAARSPSGTELDEAVRAAVAGVDRHFAERARDHHAPSASYGVFTRSGLVHTGSTGEVAGRAPTPDTIYRIASCTKSFTATALLALRDTGTLTLDDPITEYVPAFADDVLPTRDSPVPTLRMLLTMSAGFPTDDPWGDRQESLTDAGLDALLRRGLRFDSVPGTRFAYSNLGYALLGRVVTMASGKPYREVVEQSILAPLGLTSTTFTAPADASDRLAVGHRPVGDEWEPLPFSGPGAFSSIGGLFSTVTDLSRWARWLASAWSDDEAGAGDARPGTPAQAGGDLDGDLDGILSRSSRRELQQIARFVPALASQPTGYGFGLFAEQQPGLGPVVSHSGGYPGFSAHMRWHRATGVGIVAFENATYAQVAVAASTSLHALLHEIGAGPAVAVWPEVVAARARVEGLLAAAVDGSGVPDGLDDSALFSENVALDIPWSRRLVAWREAFSTVGAAAPAGQGAESARQGAEWRPAPAAVSSSPDAAPGDLPIDPAAGEESLAPSHLVWRLPGSRGRVRVELRLTPEATPRIQTLTVRAEPSA